MRAGNVLCFALALRVRCGRGRLLILSLEVYNVDEIAAVIARAFYLSK